MEVVGILKYLIRNCSKFDTHRLQPAIEEAFLKFTPGHEMNVRAPRGFERTGLKAVRRDNEADVRSDLIHDGPKPMHNVLRHCSLPLLALADDRQDRLARCIARVHVHIHASAWESDMFTTF